MNVINTTDIEIIEKLIEARESETLASYRREMDGIASLKERVSKLAEIRSREGYMANGARKTAHSC